MSHAQYTWSSFDGFHLEPELELFEIWEVMVRQIIIIVILIVIIIITIIVIIIASQSSFPMSSLE